MAFTWRFWQISGSIKGAEERAIVISVRAPVGPVYLLKIRWNFDQTLKNEKCKVQKSNLTDGDNKRFKVKISLFHPYFVFCIFQFAFCILHSIARNPQDFEQLRSCEYE